MEEQQRHRISEKISTRNSQTNIVAIVEYFITDFIFVYRIKFRRRKKQEPKNIKCLYKYNLSCF